VAVAWLDRHPDDYLTISKLLWHQDLVTTLQVYGRNFDESHAVCRMEAWLKSRRPSQQAASAATLPAAGQGPEIRNQSVASLVSRGNRWFGRRGRGPQGRRILPMMPQP
ncbi:MAG: hypothetical protein ACLQOO_04050, partial [Terriglobia bacterium]